MHTSSCSETSMVLRSRPTSLQCCFEHVELVLEALVAGRTIPSIGELGDQLQHHFFAGASDRDRRMRLLHRLGIAERFLDRIVTSLERRALLGEHRLHDVQAFLEHLEPRAHRRELVAVSLILLVHPSRAVADFETAVADMIDRRQRLRQQRRIAIRVADDHGADPNFVGLRRQSGHQRKTFMMVEVGHPARPHVIDQPYRMVAERLASMRPFLESDATIVRLAERTGRTALSCSSKFTPVRDWRENLTTWFRTAGRKGSTVLAVSSYDEENQASGSMDLCEHAKLWRG